MCCLTHAERDRIDLENGTLPQAMLASDPARQCQCDFSGTNSCKRAMTQEDLRCDWCRGTDHMAWCGDHPGANPAGVGWDGTTQDGLYDFARGGVIGPGVAGRTVTVEGTLDEEAIQWMLRRAGGGRGEVAEGPLDKETVQRMLELLKARLLPPPDVP